MCTSAHAHVCEDQRWHWGSLSSLLFPAPNAAVTGRRCYNLPFHRSAGDLTSSSHMLAQQTVLQMRSPPALTIANFKRKTKHRLNLGLQRQLRLVKCLACRYEDLSSNPRIYQKGMRVHPYNPSTGNWVIHRQIPRAHWQGSLV